MKNNGKISTWEVYMIPILIGVSSDSSHWEPFVINAIEKWNKVVGFSLFVYTGIITDKKEEDKVVFIREIVTKENPRASIKIDNNSGKIKKAFILLKNNIPENLKDRVIIHELGHVLGLEHDKEKTSVMHSIALKGEIEIEQDDINALIKVYKERIFQTVNSSH